MCLVYAHDNVIEWKHFPRNWPYVRPPVNFPHKGKWCWALMFSLIRAWTIGWVNNREAGNFRRHCAHYYVIVMLTLISLYDLHQTSFVASLFADTSRFSRLVGLCVHHGFDGVRVELHIGINFLLSDNGYLNVDISVQYMVYMWLFGFNISKILWWICHISTS